MRTCFLHPPKLGTMCGISIKFLYETERACLVEVICLPYLLLVESSASPLNLDFRVFPKSLRYGDFNGVLQFFSSLLFMKKYNLKISPNFAICNIERFFGHCLDSSIKLTGRDLQKSAKLTCNFSSSKDISFEKTHAKLIIH